MIFCQKNILEHSLSFFGEDDLLQNEMLTNNKGQSDFVTQNSNESIHGQTLAYRTSLGPSFQL